MLDQKTQGALEYLLLIGGAILVAVAVLIVLGNVLQPTKEKINETTENFLHSLENTE
ncbi:MAG: hypothetical protein DRO04_00480 [Candidatus Iainarchaeum archaeon]|uniref:Class III signal peptide-containing protein n=1 Tax=Candidatus Iainarchaeum sp. TaxID=3101447 RepID=A0A497JIG5_9ARCH|nr:MAG: hypothetical protein DRO04_00480 [Candidatus Diapherotrites archaeon]